MTDDLPDLPGRTRAGHLSDLTLELVLYEALDPGEAADVHAHLAGCPTCARRLDAARQQEATLQDVLPEHLPASEREAPEAVPAPANRPWFVGGGLAGGVAVLAAAAGLLLWIGIDEQAPAPGTRVKGAPIALEAFATDDEDTWQLIDGDAVDPDWRVGFRVVSEEVGHLWVVGVDAEAEVYPVHPPERGGPDWFEPEPEVPPTLTAAVRFDTTPGMERVVALLCEVGISYDAVADELIAAAEETPDPERLPALFSDCLQSELRLHKTEAPR